MMKTVWVVVALSGLTGCASILNDDKQALKIETYAEDGTEVVGAKCLIENGDGNYYSRSPRRVMVDRSETDMHVTCEKEGLPRAEGRVISRAMPSMFGNILFGGVVGAFVDHGNGQGYAYPEWIRLVFGKLMVFDGQIRSSDKPSEPVDTRPLPASHVSAEGAGKMARK